MSQIDMIEGAPGPVLAWATDRPAAHVVPPHHHRRSQLLYVLSGVAMVTTGSGRWLVPPEHALWIPAGVEHGFETLEPASVRSLYVKPQAAARLPARCGVVRMTDLMRSLIVEAVGLPTDYEADPRAGLVMALILEELPRLPEAPLGLPLPAEPRLAALCRGFLASPSPRETIDRWAAVLAMSRRTFTRVFRRETGLSFSIWRQHACLFAALPRLAAGEPVTSVALDLGYDSPAAFTTMFKRILGTAPRQYLREMSGDGSVR